MKKSSRDDIFVNIFLNLLFIRDSSSQEISEEKIFLRSWVKMLFVCCGGGKVEKCEDSSVLARPNTKSILISLQCSVNSKSCFPYFALILHSSIDGKA